MAEEFREFKHDIPVSQYLRGKRIWPEFVHGKAADTLKRALVEDCLEAGCWPAFDFREEETDKGVEMKMRGHVMPHDIRPTILHYCAGAMLADEEKRHA